MKKSAAISMAVLMLAATPALAHLSPVEHSHSSFAEGFAHPFSGLDHILAMVAVGLWAAMLGGKALITVPAAFVGVMVLGFAAALMGLPLPFVEPVILASVVVLGLAVAFALPVSPAVGAIIVGFFAFFHGHAHGGEMGSATFLAYGLGFALATIVLHAAGIAFGLGTSRWLSGPIGRLSMRIAGGVTTVGGLLLMAS